MNIKKCLEKLNEDIKESGLEENLFFIQTYRTFLNNIKLLDSAYKKEEYDQCRKLSVANSKIALTLFTMLQDEKMVNELKSTSNKTCPKFSKMTPKQLRQWCKKYDLDYDDFAKDYLYKALEKKWRKENG